MLNDLLSPYCTPIPYQVDAKGITDYDEDSIKLVGLENNGSYWLYSGDVVTITNDESDNEGQVHSPANDRRLLGDDGGGEKVLTTGLPGGDPPLNSCVEADDWYGDLNKHEDYTCRSNVAPGEDGGPPAWSCNIKDVAGVARKLRVCAFRRLFHLP